jgi:hypothetical protein
MFIDPLASPYYPTSSTYYTLSHPPYVGLPPAQPSSRQREYFEGKTRKSARFKHLLS